jgi:hypothetical protein
MPYFELSEFEKVLAKIVPGENLKKEVWSIKNKNYVK